MITTFGRLLEGRQKLLCYVESESNGDLLTGRVMLLAMVGYGMVWGEWKGSSQGYLPPTLP
jgi:hypothetical protein